MRQQRGRSVWWLSPLVIVVAWALWQGIDEPRAAAPLASVPPSRPVAGRAADATSSGAAASAASFTASARQARQAQRELWQQRLARAQAALAAYRESTRYPYESQPIAAHPDQVYPNRPIDEDHALRRPDGKATEGVRLRTSQERVFVQGSETVRFTVAVVDENAKPLPLRIVRASARELPAPQTAATHADLPLDFNDEGRLGDATAGDGVFSVQLQPSTQGFADLFGQIRVEVFLEFRGQQGYTYFDILYTPESPADWQGGVREALEDGSLNFYLKAKVREAGRYVVTGRVDDADGKPFALLTFNEEVAAGAQEFRLPLYGKLVRDGQPTFPLRLRDVDAFLLRQDAFPDRSLMPRLVGPVHTTRSYPLASFSQADWSSEERDRYLGELTRDVDQAKTRVDELGHGP
ncbi:MAG TPA: choice-of-anchor X domain-containing protein [Albitalea sp.]|nr:choice-of-anchor X domain-containing protein [Albitalea sp.]